MYFSEKSFDWDLVVSRTPSSGSNHVVNHAWYPHNLRICSSLLIPTAFVLILSDFFLQLDDAVLLLLAIPKMSQLVENLNHKLAVLMQ